MRAASTALALAMPWVPSGAAQVGTLATGAPPAPVIRGVLRTAPGGAAGDLPVEGALVTLLDSAEQAHGTVLTRADGTFRLPVPASGRYRVRVRRIGLAPHTSAWLAVPSTGEVPLPLAMTWVPFALPATRVRAARGCDGRPPSARTLALFEQAQLALEAERATRASRRFGVEIERFSQLVAPDGRPLDTLTRQVRRGPTTAPFVTQAPESIAVRGYGSVERDGVVFHAPDSDVLLGPAFLAWHCLSDVRDGAGLVAVGVRTSRRLPGVGLRGTLWLDSATLALRRFTFAYERLPHMLRGRAASGDLAFERLPDGAWIVRAWQLRVPAAADSQALRAWRVATVDRVEGGRVRAVHALDATPDAVVRSVGAVVAGRLLDSLPRLGRVPRPLANAEVLVVGTALHARTDSAGDFRLADVPAGQWTLAVRHAARDSLLWAMLWDDAARTVRVQGADSVHVALATPTRDALARRVCADAPRDPGRVVLGLVRDAARGAPVAGAVVRATWTQFTTSPAGPRARIDYRETTAGTDGRFALCALPLDPSIPVGLLVRSSVRTADRAGARADRLPPGAWPLPPARDGVQAVLLEMGAPPSRTPRP